MKSNIHRQYIGDLTSPLSVAIQGERRGYENKLRSWEVQRVLRYLHCTLHVEGEKCKQMKGITKFDINVQQLFC